MKIPYSVLQSFFEKKLPTPTEMYDIFTFGLCEIESMDHIETALGPDTVFDLKVLPDRSPYLLSWWGIAYETSALLGIPLKNSTNLGTFGIPGYSTGDIKLPQAIVDDSVKSPKVLIEDQASCTGYISRMIQNIKGASSPSWLTSSLESVGQRSISPIVDLTNYVMFMTGQPLHAFDADLVKGPITIRKAKEGEMMQTLDGKNVKLNPNLCVVADRENILNLAGVKGGKIPEITTKTENIILESAHFDSAYVRYASSKTGILTDASKRFENSVPEEQMEIAFNMFTSLFSFIAPNAKYGPLSGVIPASKNMNVIPISVQNVSSVLGIPLTASLCIDALLKLGIVTKKDKEGLHVSNELAESELMPDFYAVPPYWRKDLMIEEDLVEEIGRIIGYENIPPTLPSITKSISSAETSEKIKTVSVSSDFYYAEKIRETLTNNGFSEVITYTLGKDGYFETAKPLAEDKAKIRQSLLPNFKKSLEMNLKNSDFLEVDEVRQFEIGRVFTKDSEELRIAIGVAFPKKIKGKTPADRIIDAYNKLSSEVKVDLVGAKQVDSCVKENAKSKVEPSKISVQNPASLKELADAVMTQGLLAWAEFVLPAGLLSVESVDVNNGLNILAGLNEEYKNKKYKKISPYPYAVRDIAVFVKSDDPSATKESLESLIRSVAGNYLVSLRLFDVYVQPASVNSSESTNTGKTSYAFRLIFQAQDKTLVEEDIVKPMEAVYSALKDKGYEIR